MNIYWTEAAWFYIIIQTSFFERNVLMKLPEPLRYFEERYLFISQSLDCIALYV